MTSALVALCMLVQSPVYRAADYFGLVPGLKRSYMTTQDKSSLETLEEVLPSRMIDRQGVVPVQTTSAGKKLDLNFFSMDEEGVYHYAIFDESRVAPTRAVLKSFEKESKWSWTFMETGAPVQMTCIAKPGQKRTFQGREVETITLDVSGVVGNDDLAVTLKQTAIYGFRIGLLEMKETQQTKRTKTVREVKLIRIVGDGW